MAQLFTVTSEDTTRTLRPGLMSGAKWIGSIEKISTNSPNSLVANYVISVAMRSRITWARELDYACSP